MGRVIEQSFVYYTNYIRLPKEGVKRTDGVNIYSHVLETLYSALQQRRKEE